MLKPFLAEQQGKPSGGCGSTGYDLRLGNRFLVPSIEQNVILDPLNFSKEAFREVIRDDYFDLAPHSFVLTETIEYFNMPEDVMAIIMGKSTYARCGLLCNTTPAENSWKGRLTAELANLGHLPIRLYVGMGIAQALFFRGERPLKTYVEKNNGGLYQNQTSVTLPR